MTDYELVTSLFKIFAVESIMRGDEETVNSFDSPPVSLFVCFLLFCLFVFFLIVDLSFIHSSVQSVGRSNE